MPIDVLAQLSPPSWRGIPFPLVRLRNSGGHDHAHHKFCDKDGFHVEATGRNNLTFSATIPFRNGVIAAPQELWNGRTLYPDVFRAFLAACADRTSDDLIHPELGRITAKVVSFDWDYVAERRDGVDFDVTWIETLDDGDELNGIIAQQSPVATAVTVASKLDDLVTTLTPPPPELANDTASFSDMMRSIQAIPDTAALLSRQAGGLLHRVASKVDRLIAALDRLDDVRLWPVRDGAEHMRATVVDMNAKLGVDNKVILEALVPTPTNLSSLARRLNNKIDDIIRLNPTLVDEPVVRSPTRVRYYQRPT